MNHSTCISEEDHANEVAGLIEMIKIITNKMEKKDAELVEARKTNASLQELMIGAQVHNVCVNSWIVLCFTDLFLSLW